jgi:hypothetical protein
MFKSKVVKDAEFWRNRFSEGITILLPDIEGDFSLFGGIINHCAKSLSERELEEVIEILKHKAKIMLKSHNFPLIYDEMLSELIEAQVVRYGVKRDKKRKLGYSVSLGKLEEILGKYYNHEKVFIHSIHAGSSIQDTKTIVLRANKEKDDRVLFVNFHEKEREDE